MHNDHESWARYLPYIRSIAEQATRRSPMAHLDPSSIAQTAVTEAWKSRNNFRGESDDVFLAWMRGILANVMRSAVRNQIRRPQSIDFADLDSTVAACGSRIAIFASTVAGPAEELSLNERAERLTLALDQLSQDHRAVLIARHFEDRSFADIAVEMSRSEAATRMLWIRALQALRTIYIGEACGDTAFSYSIFVGEGILKKV